MLPELPGAEPVQATVQHVDQVLDAASNSFRVRLSLPNPNNQLPAGLRCKAEVPGADTLPAQCAVGHVAGRPGDPTQGRVRVLAA